MPVPVPVPVPAALALALAPVTAGGAWTASVRGAGTVTGTRSARGAAASAGAAGGTAGIAAGDMAPVAGPGRGAVTGSAHGTPVVDPVVPPAGAGRPVAGGQYAPPGAGAVPERVPVWAAAAPPDTVAKAPRVLRAAASSARRGEYRTIPPEELAHG
ncbi:hypothetical protein GCM10010140_42450 [Streptosporangium pseudovulgare]|uniref:Uncharacterized protein n=1 Tax=Streptosporangium pseudovulgare TaxID=35765 RepID=A0ABQ2R4N6_9ACTN|nr:hypothetical protein GCM10010140_42450 [Streptosporangium pseudovulgare]